MSLLRRMSQLGSKISGSRRRSNTSQISDASHGSKNRKRPSTSQASGLPSPFGSRNRSHTSAPAQKQSTTIDESDIVLHLLRMDVAMHSYFCFHMTPDFQYPGAWVNKTLQQLLTHVPVLYPKDPSAYQDWVVSLAIDFIEQHNTNIKRLTDIARQVRAGTLNEQSHPGTVSVSQSMNSDVARLTELVRKLEPRLGKPKSKEELFELTNICISTLKQQLVAIDEDWDFHKEPWEGDYLGSIEDTWDYIHSSHGRTPFNNKELARVVELIYNNHANVELLPPQEESDEEIQPDPNPEPPDTNKDGISTKPSKGLRRHLHTEASSEDDSPRSKKGQRSRSRAAPSEQGENSAHSRRERRSRSGTDRPLRTEEEQEEYIEHLKRRRARKEKEEAEYMQEKGLQNDGEQGYHDYRQQRRLQKEESEQAYLDHLQRNRSRRERKEQKRRASGASPPDDYEMSGAL
ncbi:hypothetical protein MMC18_002946 [Xylographa bjoerkii]|nr:hypothetical protein [Xylographa bjoerkii]